MVESKEIPKKYKSQEESVITIQSTQSIYFSKKCDI